MPRSDPATLPAAVSTADLRTVMSRFATGVVVITVGGEHIHGMTANAFSSVSLDPPTVLCCVAKSAVMHDALAAAGRFAASIMSGGQEHHARYFADKQRPLGPPQFAAVEHFPGPRTGAPVLADSAGWIECDLEAAFESGDHTIFVGAVTTVGTGDTADGLVFFDRRFHLFTPDTAGPAPTSR
jgi:flavin reductase